MAKAFVPNLLIHIEINGFSSRLIGGKRVFVSAFVLLLVLLPQQAGDKKKDAGHYRERRRARHKTS
jgi:hypothetical protein